jgi:hypothetical protein
MRGDEQVTGPRDRRAARAAPAVVRNAVRFQVALWRSLLRWASSRRRADAGPDGTAFAYHSTVAPMLLTTLVVSVIEIVAVHLLLPWPTARAALLVLGIWSAFLVAGTLAAFVVHPHIVGPDRLRVRLGAQTEIAVPLDAVRSIRRVQRDHSGKSVQVNAHPDGDRLALAVSGRTTIEIVLDRVVPVHLPGGRVARISRLSFDADEPGRLVAEVRSRLRAGQDAEGAR